MRPSSAKPGSIEPYTPVKAAQARPVSAHPYTHPVPARLLPAASTGFQPDRVTSLQTVCSRLNALSEGNDAEALAAAKEARKVLDTLCVVAAADVEKKFKDRTELSKPTFEPYVMNCLWATAEHYTAKPFNVLKEEREFIDKITEAERNALMVLNERSDEELIAKLRSLKTFQMCMANNEGKASIFDFILSVAQYEGLRTRASKRFSDLQAKITLQHWATAAVKNNQLLCEAPELWAHLSPAGRVGVPDSEGLVLDIPDTVLLGRDSVIFLNTDERTGRLRKREVFDRDAMLSMILKGGMGEPPHEKEVMPTYIVRRRDNSKPRGCSVELLFGMPDLQRFFRKFNKKIEQGKTQGAILQRFLPSSETTRSMMKAKVVRCIWNREKETWKRHLIANKRPYFDLAGAWEHEKRFCVDVSADTAFDCVEIRKIPEGEYPDMLLQFKRLVSYMSNYTKMGVVDKFAADFIVVTTAVAERSLCVGLPASLYPAPRSTSKFARVARRTASAAKLLSGRLTDLPRMQSFLKETREEVDEQYHAAPQSAMSLLSPFHVPHDHPQQLWRARRTKRLANAPLKRPLSDVKHRVNTTTEETQAHDYEADPHGPPEGPDDYEHIRPQASPPVTPLVTRELSRSASRQSSMVSLALSQSRSVSRQGSRTLSRQGSVMRPS
eukprot:CAMPEP_0114549334 /NCGR_PEP_ID=MMETSP0114-20121206/5472_1 /TAXON_ID=31324 /ORGANISM="Goniomonas sp, Strain m" /LENGTH=666 /DNA_ID=CAMNT_0001734009 /DNA_START=48 /DNA_END=2045 /DNA_ORIENTATION=+